jgi:hypothetical protein
MCWLFHDWSKWSATQYSKDRVPFQARTCATCHKTEVLPVKIHWD